MNKMIKINLKGPIVNDSQKRIYDWMGMDAVCPKDISDNLPDNGEEIELTVNSPGGIVDAGSEIYTALREYTGQITAKVVGMAASAASVVIMAADTVKISPTARIMIHNGWRYAEGDHRDMESAKEALTTADKGIRSAYISKTKLSESEITELMNKETYMDAQKALDLGFADEIMFQEDAIALAASVENGLLSETAINKVRTIMAKESDEPPFIAPAVNLEEIAQMKNELLKEEILNSLY
ncbi:head maturation protease, ClpP-related [Carnobacterium antarcticum]|uniref:ATP-dependent Clp protease proteolytic subunit n=1 Tax=Carnobacterium antarcticum TaxID=2126436 RepID=A0ABW4NLQ1_9LACT|nr:head maturation protease, ClpP-related [Carnobacterium sp. CP1]